MDNISNNTEGLRTGIAKATKLIRASYGSAGGNVIVQEGFYPYYAVRNDAKKIVDAVKLADAIENIGVDVLREAGDKADKDSGDGRKTTMILTEAILNAAAQVEGHAMDIKRSLDEVLPVVVANLESQVQPLEVGQVKAVATVSAENEALGQVIQDIYQEIGPDGIIEVENSSLPATIYEIVDGVRLRYAGWLGNYSSTEPGRAVFKNPKILITKDKITSVDQLEPLIGALKGQDINELVIYCDDIDLSVASRMALTHLQGAFKSLIIKSPTLWKDWLFADFAVMTGATAVDSANGKTFKNLTLEDLGTCTKIVTTDSETRVIGIRDISEHIKRLQEAGLKDDQQKLRASWLNTKVATLKVGANSESELAYLAKKAKDACAAAHLALKGGVVQGGGVALFNVIDKWPILTTVGGKILTEALKAPLYQIWENTGQKEVYDYGPTVLDPLLVVKNALTNAVSLAGIVLTTRGIITMNKDK